MRCLVDTNIFLEGILEQQRAMETRAFWARAEEHELFISDYTLHSIGHLLFRQRRYAAFQQFLTDVFLNAGVRMVALLAEDMEVVMSTAQRFSLDFDDAYQHAVARKYGLAIVSFDSDFDRTEQGRRTPAEILGS